MSVEASKSPDLSQTGFVQIQTDLKQLAQFTFGEMAVARNPPQALTGTPSEKIASILSSLYTDVATIEATGKPLSDRRYVLEEAGKILDEVSKLEGSGETSAKEKDQKSSKGNVDETNDPIAMCRAFLDKKKEQVDKEILDDFRSKIDQIPIQDNNEPFKPTAEVCKLLNALPSDIIKKAGSGYDLYPGNAKIKMILDGLFFKLCWDPTSDGGDVRHIKKIFPLENPLTSATIDYIMKVIDKNSWLVNRVIESYNALKNHAKPQDAFEAAVYFARKFHDQPIGPTPKEMMAVLEYFKNNLMGEHKPAFTDIEFPCTANALKENIGVYKLRLKELKTSIDIAKKIDKSLDASLLQKDFLTEGDLDYLENLNTQILAQTEDFQKVVDDPNLKPDEKIKALKTLNSLMVSNIEKAQKILPNAKLAIEWMRHIADTIDSYEKPE